MLAYGFEPSLLVALGMGGEDNDTDSDDKRGGVSQLFPKSPSALFCYSAVGPFSTTTSVKLHPE